VSAAKFYVQYGKGDNMSKIGRKPISLGDVQVQIQGHTVTYKGNKASGTHELPDFITAEIEGKFLKIGVLEKLRNRDTNRFWGLHRALLANAIQGADAGFTKQMQINGLGFKAALAGSKVVFTIGYTHKIDLMLPKEVTLEVDKTGQLLTFKSPDRRMLGEICDKVRSFRPPEPYKGTGIKYKTEVIVRKAGKTKAATT
jgi:large subunit ribosomal protein L6